MCRCLRGQPGQINHCWFGLQSLRCDFPVWRRSPSRVVRRRLGLEAFHVAGHHSSRGHPTENCSIKIRAVNQQTGYRMATSGNLPPGWKNQQLKESEVLSPDLELNNRHWGLMRFSERVSGTHLDLCFLSFPTSQSARFQIILTTI